jgi:hypothetical protein
VPLNASNLIENPLSLRIDQRQGLNPFCVDQDFLDAIRAPPEREWEQHYLEYILVTGANWASPIKKFRLVIDKGATNNIVSFCGHGVRAISPSQFEMNIVDFVPRSNLQVLFLTPRDLVQRKDRGAPTFNDEGDLATLNCHDLWIQRNKLFKAAGYCFHTANAISAFGNAGCRHDDVADVPLSERDRALMTAIRGMEQRKGCHIQ